jgi:hypothetical protein
VMLIKKIKNMEKATSNKNDDENIDGPDFDDQEYKEEGKVSHDGEGALIKRIAYEQEGAGRMNSLAPYAAFLETWTTDRL